MAALVLSGAGAAAGGALFGGAGAMAGRLAGAVAGSLIDRAVTGGGAQHVYQTREGPRLRDLDVMASQEGAPIPRVYGRARLSGQVIWATALVENVRTRTETTGGGGGGGGKSSSGSAASPTVTTTTTTYEYFANFAVGLCEGPIGRVLRVWADGKPFDLSGVDYRVYTGTEDQEADPLIVAKEGAGHAPAYRGLAYVVFERLPVAAFGNRMPQLSFEVMRPVGRLESQVRAITLIPGATEFGYDIQAVVRNLGPGRSAPENRHVSYAQTDVIAALDELQAVCPNLERLAIVVTWFGDDLRAGHCRIRPMVDNAAKDTHGATWSVAGLSRHAAYVVSQSEGRAAYGGTPSDASVRRLIAEVKARGLKVTLYPFVMMDVPSTNTLSNPWTGFAPQPAYPWRGEITCFPAPGVEGSPDGTGEAGAQVAAFLSGGGGSGWNYRRMILHYASLAMQAGGVDAFLIGSELRGLTRVRSTSGVYPAVDGLMSLAADVRALLGEATTITYAADWTEYGAHVVDDGAQEVRFPLDPLWAHEAIDAVGIDYYAPLSDWRDTPDHADRALSETIHDRAYLRGNLAGGEAYDFYYADDAARLAQTRSPITDGLGKPWIFRQKDLWNFWSQPHVERVDGVELASATAWVPQSKPVWLTETGCPAIDKGANQPNVFPDLRSDSGGVPHFSNRRRDDLIQRRYLETILAAFAPGSDLNPRSSLYDGHMVDPSAIHVWTWDARPYPVFPRAIDVWSDGPNWETGHWLSGRLGGGNMEGLLGAVISDAGFAHADVSALGEGPEGYVIDRPMAARAAIEPLARAYAFDAAENNGRLVFRPRGLAPIAELTLDDCVLPERGVPLRLTRAQETELPRQVTLSFSDVEGEYRRAAAASRRLTGGAAGLVQSDLAMVTTAHAAARRCDIWMQDLWAGRESADLILPPSRLALTPGDTIAISDETRRRIFEIVSMTDTAQRAVTARGIDPDVFDVPLALPVIAQPALPAAIGPVAVRLLDLPTFDASEPVVLTRAAIFADPWPGPVSLWRARDGLSFDLAGHVTAPAIMGETMNALPRGPVARIDHASVLHVQLYGGVLFSVPDSALLNGANLAALQRSDGACEIIQFGVAELIGENTYALSRLLRGQGGSEGAMSDPLPAGAGFVLLDAQVVPVARGLDMLGRPFTLRIVAASRDHADAAAVVVEHDPRATALLPYAPVHPTAQRNADGIVLRWIRRTRIDGDSWEALDVPLGEAQERYAVDILAGDTLLRSLETGTPQVLYPQADELADFGSLQTSLTLRVAQISASAGRGNAITATLSI